jgi:hypothetical protein
MTALGAQCKGERHEQVIVRQREAINELRQRIKILEQDRPSSSVQSQHMQQQIMVLKKQLAELRANQALSENNIKQVNIARGQDQDLIIHEEKSKNFETSVFLQDMEESVKYKQNT